jgi:hypothetical protein
MRGERQNKKRKIFRFIIEIFEYGDLLLCQHQQADEVEMSASGLGQAGA